MIYHDILYMENPNYLSSKEAKKKLKISSCQLMHLRIEGKLNYIKKGNSFYYDSKDMK